MAVIVKDGKKLLRQMLIRKQEKICRSISYNKKLASLILILNANLHLPGQIDLDINYHLVNIEPHTMDINCLILNPFQQKIIPALWQL